ncbi:unnamed protein product, partial [Lampetra fluviatilis]
RACVAISRLQRLHSLHRRRPRPHSLYLDALLTRSLTTTAHHPHHHHAHQHHHAHHEVDEAVLQALRDTGVLSNPNHLQWNWDLIRTLLKWPGLTLKSCKEEMMHRFVRRLLHFVTPSARLFSCVDAALESGRSISLSALDLTTFLLHSDDDGVTYLDELLKDIVSWLSMCPSLSGGSERCLSASPLSSTLSSTYPLILGSLTPHSRGLKALEKAGVFQTLLRLCGDKSQELLMRLVVTACDYCQDGLARVLLSKTLTGGTESTRVYATLHLRVLLRIGVDFFTNWGVELLLTQLHDPSPSVAHHALTILHEACDDKANLHALVQMKPALSHLGESGALLLIRFASISKGFSYLNERGFITKELERWRREYNVRYVDIVEQHLNDALTTWTRGQGDARRSSQRTPRPSVFLPPHFYGQLSNHKTGAHLLEAQIFPALVYDIRNISASTWEDIKRLKAALWAL